ncbi:MAG: hypothetical protein II578_03525 [Bacteroidaceae bacterium]|nr:hypothetical protein [Bacteroidaceae bacterium]
MKRNLKRSSELYEMELRNMRTGDVAVVTLRADARLEELSPKIKLALSLPLVDRKWHRFLLNGAAWVPEEHVELEPEMLWEAEVPPERPYYSSDRVRLRRMFTTLGSAFVYAQSRDYLPPIMVRCTLLRRLPSDYLSRTSTTLG